MAENTLAFNFVAHGEGTVVRALGKVDAAVSKLGGKIKTAGVAAFAIGGAAAAGAFGTALASAMDIADARAKLTAQLDLSTKDSEKLGKVAGNLYTNAYGDSLSEINEAIRKVVNDTGTSLNDVNLQPLTGKIISVSKAFDQDLGGVTRAVGQLMRTKLAKNADEALDIVAKGFSSGADKAEDLLDTLNEYGTQFRKLGLNGGQAIGIINQGLKAGARDADTVADALKEFAIRAVDGSKTTASGFKSIGLSAKKMSEDIGKGGTTASKALDLTLDRLRGIKDPVTRAQVAVELFGTKAEDLGDALFKLDPSEATKGLGKLGGAAERVDKAMGSSPRSTITKYSRTLQSGLTNAVGGGLQIFERLWGEYGPRITAGLSKFADTVRDNIPAVDWSALGKSLQTSAEGWASALIPGLRKGLDKGDWSGLGTTLGEGLASAFGSVGKGLGDIAGALSKWAASVDWLQIGKDIGTQAVPFVAGFLSGFLDPVVIYESIKKHPFDWAIAVTSLVGVGKAGGVIAKVLERIPFLRLFAPLFRGLNTVTDGLLGWAGRAAGRFASFVGREFLTGFRKVFPEAGKALDAFLSLLPTRIGVWGLQAAGAAKRAVYAVGNAISGATGWVIRKTGELIALMLRPWANAGSWLLGKGMDLIRGLWRGASSLLGGAAGLAKSAVGSVARAFAGSAKWLWNEGRQLLEGLFQGALGSLDAVGDWAKRIGSRIVSAVKSYFGIKSPSRVFAGIGGQLMAGLAQGVLANNPEKMILKVFGGMTQALNTLVGKGVLNVMSLSDKALKSLGGVFSPDPGNLLPGLTAAESYIIQHESGGRTTAQNPTSTAFGLGQLIYANRKRYGEMIGVSPDTTNYAAQLQMFRLYVRERYGNAENAASFWKAHHWYGDGGVISEPVLGIGLRSGQRYGFGERGPETVIPGRVSARGGGGVHVHLHTHGPVGSPMELESWLLRALDAARAKGRLRVS